MKISLFAYSKSIFEIPLDFYKENNIKVIFVDLDNTLDPYNFEYPSNRTIDYVNKLINANIIINIISNNKKHRILKYISKLNGVLYLSKAFKPFSFKIKRYIKRNNFQKDDIVFIGDQIQTDIKCANKLKVRSILTEKLVNKEQIKTKINRLFEKRKRKKIIGELEKTNTIVIGGK